MNATTYPAPPKDFDPTTAPANTLLQYGYPRRPDAQTEPALRALWDRAMARKPTFVQAQLVEDKVWHSKPHALWKKDQFGLAGDWAGAVVQVSSLGFSPPQPANVVFAEWKVPTIQPKPTEPGSQTVGFWVGLGGWGVANLLQAGTAATITGTSVTYWTWVEWVPASYKVENLSIEAGDTVSVLVCAPESDHGFVSMMNQRTNMAISVGVPDPDGTTPYDGSTVEWIVEAITTEMPNFGSVLFTQITAGTQNHTFDLKNAFTVNTVSGSTTLATGKVLEPQNEVEVIWNAAT